MYSQNDLSFSLYNGKTDLALKSIYRQINDLKKANNHLDFSKVWAADVNEAFEAWASRQLQAAYKQGAAISTSVNWMFSSLNKALSNVQQVVSNTPKPVQTSLEKPENENKVDSATINSNLAEAQAYANRLVENRVAYGGNATQNMAEYLAVIAFNEAVQNKYAGYAPYLLELGHYMGGYKVSPFADLALQWARAAVELAVPEKVTFDALQNRIRQIHHSQGLDLNKAKAQGLPEKPLAGNSNAVATAAYAKAFEVLSALNFTGRVDAAKKAIVEDSLVNDYYNKLVAIYRRYPQILNSYNPYEWRGYATSSLAQIIEGIVATSAVNQSDYGVAATRGAILRALSAALDGVSQAAHGKSQSFLSPEQKEKLFGAETLAQAPNSVISANERETEEKFSQNAANFESEKKRILNDSDILFHANRLAQIYSHPATTSLPFYQRWAAWGNLPNMVEAYLKDYMSRNLAIGGAIITISSDLTKAYDEASQTIAEYERQQALAAEKARKEAEAQRLAQIAAEKERIRKEQEQQPVIGKGSSAIENTKIPLPDTKPQPILQPDPIKQVIPPAPVVAPGSAEEIKITDTSYLTPKKEEKTTIPSSSAPQTASIVSTNWQSVFKYGGLTAAALLGYKILKGK